MAIGLPNITLHHAARTGPSDHSRQIFVENLNCPDLTASFLAGAKDLWRIQKTACLLLPPLLYLGSSGQFPEWLTFDVSDPKVLRGVLEGDSFKASGDLLSPSMGVFRGAPGSAQDALRLWAGHFRATRVFSSAPPGHYPLGHGSHDFVPGLWGLLLDTRPTSFDLGHYLCSKGILNASLEALLGLS